MKKKHWLLLPMTMMLSALCTTFISCGDDDDADADAPVVLEVHARPTDWTPVDQNIDLQSTMIVDVEVDLNEMRVNYEYDEQDLMAAFIDGSCRAVAGPKPLDENNTTVIFPLNIKKLTTDKSDAQVTLKFYSARLQHVFTLSTPFYYVAEGVMGSILKPYKPVWKQ